MARVWHYDGSSGIRHDAEFQVQADGFRLHIGGTVGEVHPWEELYHLGLRGGQSVYGLNGRRGWQIGFAEEAPPEILAHLPKAQHYGGFIDRLGFGPASLALACLSVALIFVVMKVPDVLAPFVPLSWEKKLGDAMIGDFGGRFCHGPGSDAALRALTKRLDLKGPQLDIQLANIDIVNAVALPGGNIIIFRGLLKEAHSPDELAGVLGHEIGHVRHRDVMQSLLRQLGLSVVMGGANSNVGGTFNALVASTYSREAEANADSYSIGLMKAADISASDTAGFFARLAGDEKKMGKAAAALGYLSSHPMSKSREKKFRASVIKGQSYRPALSAEQWQAILMSCAKDPTVAKESKILF